MSCWLCPKCEFINFSEISKCSKCACFRSKATRWYNSVFDMYYKTILKIMLPVSLIVLYILYQWFSIIMMTILSIITIVVCYKNFDHIVNIIKRCVTCLTYYYYRIRSKTVDGMDLYESNGTCIICFDRSINTSITVCGHFGFCFECASSMNSCPICRIGYDPNTNLQRTFMVN